MSIFSNFKLPMTGLSEEGNPLLLGKDETIHWAHSDYKEKFENNLKIYPDSVHLQNYKKNPITYDLNNYGFRTPDDFFHGDEGTVYLGCSQTFGVGHYLENVWSYKLHQKIGEGKFFNLSFGGTGLTSQYYFLKYFSDKLKIKKVYHFYPLECKYRYGFMNQDGIIRILGYFAEDDKTDFEKEIWKKYLVHETYNELHNSTHKDAIKNICKEIGCDYVLGQASFVQKPDPYHKKLTPPRDLEHYYVEHQHKVYENFLQLSNYENSII